MDRPEAERPERSDEDAATPAAADDSAHVGRVPDGAEPVPIGTRWRLLWTAAEVEAVSSVVREQMLEVITSHAGPAMVEAALRSGEGDVGISIREIGRQLGRKPGSLYRHIDILLAVGLIERVGSEVSGGREATTFAATGDTVVFLTPTQEGPELEALCRYFERAGAHAGRETAARARRFVETGGWLRDRRGYAALSMAGWLNEAQRAELNTAIRTIARLFEHSDRRPGTKLIAASVFARPVRLPGDDSAEAAAEE